MEVPGQSLGTCLDWERVMKAGDKNLRVIGFLFGTYQKMYTIFWPKWPSSFGVNYLCSTIYVWDIFTIFIVLITLDHHSSREQPSTWSREKSQRKRLHPLVNSEGYLCCGDRRLLGSSNDTKEFRDPMVTALSGSVTPEGFLGFFVCGLFVFKSQFGP